MYVDIHSHYLAAVDDGSPDITTSLKWLSRAEEEGVEGIVTTPHISNFYQGSRGLDPRNFVPAAFAELEAAAADLSLRLYCGGELNPTSAISQTNESLAVIALGPEERQWLLLEASVHFDFDRRFVRAADHLRKLGYGIVLAHPERAPNIHSRKAQQILLDEIERGSLLQVNLSSLVSADHAMMAKYLIEEGLCYCIASDIHPPERTRSLSLLPDYLERLGLDGSLAEKLAGSRPRRLVEDGFPLV